MAIFEKHVPIVGTDVNEISVSVDYNLGGMNYWNYHIERRGYYLHIIPQMRTSKNGYTCVETIWPNEAGFKVLLKEVTRQSKKAEAEAIRLAQEMIDNCVEKCCEIGGYSLAEEV